jgi:hypothetical protein
VVCRTLAQPASAGKCQLSLGIKSYEHTEKGRESTRPEQPDYLPKSFTFAPLRQIVLAIGPFVPSPGSAAATLIHY